MNSNMILKTEVAEEEELRTSQE